MFIIWGTRHVRQHRGYVADFCAICRGIKRFHVSDIRVAHHFFFIPFAKSETTSQMRACTACGQQSFPEPGTYDAFVADAQADIDTLVRETNPALLEKLTERLVLEERAKQSLAGLSAGERTTLLTEPFVALSEQVGRRFARGGCSNILASLALVASLFLFCLWIVYSDEPGSATRTLAWVAGVVSWILFPASLYFFATSSRRYMKGRIVPLLARALKPLEPTEPELAKVIETLEADGYKIAWKLKAEWILASIRTPQASASEQRGR